MGLDFGDKTIGIAVSDALRLTAQSKGVIKRDNLTSDLEKIKNYIKKYQVSEIVVGMPKNMDGTLGPRAEKTQQFINFLSKRIDLPVETWDERLSTVQAEKILIKADLSRKKRKKVVDQLAAAVILQGYLDRKKHRQKQ